MRYKKAPEITVTIGEGVYHMTVTQIPTDTLNLDERPTCLSCHKYLKVIGETFERGKRQDKGTLRMVCRRCNRYFLYNYHLSIESEDNSNAREAQAD